MVVFLESLAYISDLSGFDSSNTSSKTEVANFYTAILVDKDVGGLEIAMQYVCGVEILDRAQ
jgi:hypothetical protein